MIKKVIFFTESVFTERDEKRYGMSILKERGFDVEVWDFTIFLHKEFYDQIKMPDPNKHVRQRIFKYRHEAINAILKLPRGVLIICTVGYEYNSYDIFKAISRAKLPYAVILACTLPFHVAPRKMGPRELIEKLKKTNFERLKKAALRRITCPRSGIAPVAFVIAGGSRTVIEKYPIGPKSEIIWAHNLDYDIYLEERNRPFQVDPDQGVFLDEYMPLAVDFFYMGVAPFSTPDVYYPTVRKFFDMIERTYNKRVIIAAHPTSRYESHPEYFGDRLVERGRTLEFVKTSAFAIAHNSTTINMAVLYAKPVIFITTDDIERSLQGPWVRTMASWLGKQAINISHTSHIDFEKEMVIDEKAYDNYRNSYIKKDGTEDAPLWEIFANRIKRSYEHRDK